MFGNAVSSGRQNAVFNNGPAHREFTASNNESIPTTNEYTVNVQTLERWLTDTIVWIMLRKITYEVSKFT